VNKHNGLKKSRGTPKTTIGLEEEQNISHGRQPTANTTRQNKFKPKTQQHKKAGGRASKQTGEQSRKLEGEQANGRAGKQTGEQANGRAGKQTGEQARRREGKQVSGQASKR
jgi:hypothetical protein